MPLGTPAELRVSPPGFIGKITLQIPFYRPHSDPWVISMSQLNLIIGPAQPPDTDPQQERERERERKRQLLQALEDKWKVRGGLFLLCGVVRTADGPSRLIDGTYICLLV